MRSRRMRPRIWSPLAVATAALALLVAAPASAIVPPTDCGMIRVEGKRYNVKADQLRCSTVKPRAQRFLRSHRRPSGYRCRTYSPRDTKTAFRCSKGIRVFFAIRR